jgi:DNA invertase Pin-like site-specific DNA recombinase
MTIEEVIEHFGSITEAARALKVSRPVVYRWQKNGIPIQYKCYIEYKTKGALKVDRRSFNGS